MKYEIRHSTTLVHFLLTVNTLHIGYEHQPVRKVKRHHYLKSESYGTHTHTNTLQRLNDKCWQAAGT